MSMATNTVFGLKSSTVDPKASAITVTKVAHTTMAADIVMVKDASEQFERARFECRFWNGANPEWDDGIYSVTTVTEKATTGLTLCSRSPVDNGRLIAVIDNGWLITTVVDNVNYSRARQFDIFSGSRRKCLWQFTSF